MADEYEFTEPPVYVLRDEDGKLFVVPGEGAPFYSYHSQVADVMREHFGPDALEVCLVLDGEFSIPDPVWQRDPRWRDAKLGYSDSGADSTLGRYGCVVCSFAWILSVIHQEDVLPVRVNAEFASASVFGGETRNLVVWDRVDDAYPIIKVTDDVICTTVPAPIARMREWLDLREGRFLICQFDFEPGGAVQSHYSPVISITDDGAVGKLADPWTGQVAPVPPGYMHKDWRPWDFGRAVLRVVFVEQQEGARG